MNTIKTQIQTTNHIFSDASDFFALLVSFLFEIWPLALVTAFIALLIWL